MYEEPMSYKEFLRLEWHYGVRTMLLDWTTDAIVALFLLYGKGSIHISRILYFGSC